MSKKNYIYVPCIKYGHNGGVMGDKYKNMQDAWDWLLEYKQTYHTRNDVVFIGVIKCREDESAFSRIMDIDKRSNENIWEKLLSK